MAVQIEFKTRTKTVKGVRAKADAAAAWPRVQSWELVLGRQGDTLPPQPNLGARGPAGGSATLAGRLPGRCFLLGPRWAARAVAFRGPTRNGAQGPRGQGSAQVTGPRVTPEVARLASRPRRSSVGFVAGTNGRDSVAETEVGAGGLGPRLERCPFCARLRRPVPRTQGAGRRQEAGGSAKLPVTGKPRDTVSPPPPPANVSLSRRLAGARARVSGAVSHVFPL